MRHVTFDDLVARVEALERKEAARELGALEAERARARVYEEEIQFWRSIGAGKGKTPGARKMLEEDAKP